MNFFSRVLALEVESPFEIREGLTEAVEKALPEFIARAKKSLREMLDQ
jgi:hypothetical protein